MKLKLNMNTFKEENIKLKTKAQLYEKEIDKKDRLIQELLEQMSTQTGKGPKAKVNETHLIFALKKQIKEIKTECNQKDLELKQLRKNIKITRNQENEIEKKMYIDECSRLRRVLEDTMNNKARDGYSKEEVAELETNNQQMNVMLKQAKQEIGELNNLLYRKREAFYQGRRSTKTT